MQKKTKYAFLLTPILSAAILLLVLFSTDPVSIGPGGILGVFVLIYLFALSMLFVVLHFGIHWFTRLTARAKQDGTSRYRRIEARKAYYIASIIAFVPVLFLAMQSFAELRLSDIVLVGVFVSIAVFYVIKRV